MLTVNKTVEGKKATFNPKGRLDTMTAPEMEKEIQTVISDIDELTLDFKELEYISSAGLRVLLAAQKAMDPKGKMKVVNVNETIMEIFEVTGFSDILTIE